MAGSGLIQTCTEMAKFVSVLSGKFVSNTVHEKSPRSIALMTDRNLEHLSVFSLTIPMISRTCNEFKDPFFLCLAMLCLTICVIFRVAWIFNTAIPISSQY